MFGQRWHTTPAPVIRLWRANGRRGAKSNQRSRLKCATANKIRKVEDYRSSESAAFPPLFARVGREMPSDKLTEKSITPLSPFSWLMSSTLAGGHCPGSGDNRKWKASEAGKLCASKNSYSRKTLTSARYCKGRWVTATRLRGHVPWTHLVINEGGFHIQPHFCSIRFHRAARKHKSWKFTLSRAESENRWGRGRPLLIGDKRCSGARLFTGICDESGQ